MATIKKIILLTLTALMMVGCKKEEPKQENVQPIVETDVVYRYSIMTIDSCEYIGYGAHGISHKGNCKFCAERRQNELEELIKKLKEK